MKNQLRSIWDRQNPKCHLKNGIAQKNSRAKTSNLFEEHNNAVAMPVKGSGPGSSLTGIALHV